MLKHLEKFAKNIEIFSVIESDDEEFIQLAIYILITCMIKGKTSRSQQLPKITLPMITEAPMNYLSLIFLQALYSSFNKIRIDPKSLEDLSQAMN